MNYDKLKTMLSNLGYDNDEISNIVNVILDCDN